MKVDPRGKYGACIVKAVVSCVANPIYKTILFIFAAKIYAQNTEENKEFLCNWLANPFIQRKSKPINIIEKCEDVIKAWNFFAKLKKFCNLSVEQILPNFISHPNKLRTASSRDKFEYIFKWQLRQLLSNFLVQFGQ